MPTHASPLIQFFGETSNHPGDSAPLQPRFGALQHLAFPKTKITFEREDISDSWWDSGNIWWGSWWWLGELCEVPRWLWRGLRCHCPMYNVSCILNKCLYFYSTWLDTFWAYFTYPHKILYKSVYSSQNVETTWMSINWWIDKWNFVYLYNEILFLNKKGWSTNSCYSMNKP